MLDIDVIRADPDRVAAALSKRVDGVDLSGVLSLDDRRREQRHLLEVKRSERKQYAQRISEARRAGGDSSGLEAEATELRTAISNLEAELASTEEQFHAAMVELPNVPADEVPAGGKEGNVVVKTWGEPRDLGDKGLDHVELCTRLGLVDYERGTKLGGSGFWLYKGRGAALEWALLDYFCKTHVADGYEFMLPPHLLLTECGYTAGQFPKFVDDVFLLAHDDDERERFLLPTSETAILNVYRDETLPLEDLPIKAFAYTPCYRREKGGYRSDERGTVRGHQFNKVEIFQFVAEDGGDAALREMVGKSERIVEELGLHYRTSLLAAKDASASMKITYDIEVWIPSIGGYKEVSSASYAGDYQARRANIRYRPAGEKKTRYVHTLNASALATSRLLPAIVEQCQQPDGSIRVPEPLRDWLRADTIA